MNVIQFEKELNTLKIAKEISSHELILHEISPSIDICFKNAALNLELQHIQILDYSHNSSNIFMIYNYQKMTPLLQLFPFLERLYITHNKNLGPWLACQSPYYLGATLPNTLKFLHLNNCNFSQLPYLKLLNELEIAIFDNNPKLGQDLVLIENFNTRYFPESIKYISFANCNLTKLPKIDFDLFPNLAGIWVNNNPQLILTEEQKENPRIFRISSITDIELLQSDLTH